MQVALDARAGVAKANGTRQGQGALAFVAPALIIYTLLVIYPMIYAIVMSFYEWDGISPTRTFVGLDNYINVLTTDTVFWRALANSSIWVVLSLIFPTGFGLALAVALNQRLFGQSAFRTAFYLPAVIASIAVASIWSWMYNPSLGIINAVFRQLGMDYLIQDWLGNRNIALFSVFIAFIWQTTGTNMVLFLAGLQTIPADLIEAARVDGANRQQVFRFVTIPSLRQTFVVVFSLSIINSLKVFDLVYGLTAGGPGQSSHVLGSWAYFQALQLRNYGSGMAIVVILLLITLVIVVPYLRWMMREEE
jgi:raffinose/stachyose/melibiose transport system permease protein